MDPMQMIHDLVRRVESASLTLHLAALPGPRCRALDGAPVRDALIYLRDTMRGYGWQVSDQPCRDSQQGAGVNIVATLPGAVRPETLVVVGAHHDTIPESPGADDNGSGLAGLLELARLLPRYRWASTIQLVAFDFEEVGFLGSRAYVEALLPAQRLHAALILEMIGYANDAPGSQQIPHEVAHFFPQVAQQLEEAGARANFLALLGSELHRPLLQQIVEWAATGAPDLPLAAVATPHDLPLPDLFRSDHVPFWERSLPAVTFTDTGNFRNRHYHLPSDHPGTLDPAFWRRVMAATVAVVAALAEPVSSAELGEPPFTRG